MGLETAPFGVPSPTFWRNAEGRGWRWEIDDAECRLIDRDGGLAVRLWAVGERWYSIFPKAIPMQSAVGLEAAKGLAVSMALANVPVDPITAARIERANTNPARAAYRIIKDKH